VELSTCSASVVRQHAIARSKAERDASGSRAQSRDPGGGHALELKAANVRAVFKDYDLVLDGTDRLATRYLVNDACVILGLPLVSAAIHRFEGQVMTTCPAGTVLPVRVPAGARGRGGQLRASGRLGVLPGVLGTLQATEAIS